MSEPFSFDEFSLLVNQINNSSSSDKPSLSTEAIQQLDSMTRYFYLKEKESRDDNNESDNSQKKITTQTILDSTYHLMNIYRQSLQMLANSFVVSYSPSATDMIKEISQTLKIDPASNITQQILFKLEKNNQNESIQDENNNKISISRSKLSSVLKVSPNATEEEIVKAIQNQKQIIDSQNDKTDTGLFEMPNETLEKQIKNDILKEHVSELEKLIKTERKEKSELSDKVNNLNMKIITLERKVDDYEHTIAVQKALIDDQKELSIPQQEGIFSLQKTIQTLSSQLDLLTQDLSDLAKQKENLVRITEKQSAFINTLMKEAEKMSKTETTETNIIDAEQFYSSDLFDRILETTATISSPCVDHITDIIHDGYNKSDYEKVIEIVSALIDDIRNKQDSINKLQSNNNANDNNNNNNNISTANTDLNESKSLLSMGLAQKIMVALAHEVSFVERIANSKNDRNWIKPQEVDDDLFRQTLQEESERAHSFLEDNCKGIIEDALNEIDTFDSLQINGDPLQFQESLKIYLDSYPTLVTDEGRSLMTILRHATAAVSILFRYGIEVKNQYQRQLSQVKSLNIEMEFNNKEMESLRQSEEAATQKLADMQDIIRQTLNILQTAALQLTQGDTVTFPNEEGEGNELENTEAEGYDIYNSQSYALKTVLEAIDHVLHFKQVDDDEYQKTIESKLIETLNDLDELRNSRMNEISEYENRSFSMRDQAEKDIQRQKIALEKQKVAFENASDEIKQLKIDIQLLTDSLHESQKNNQELQEKLNSSRITTREAPDISMQAALESDNNSVNSVDLSSTNNTDMKKEMRKLEKKFQRSLIAIHVQEKEKRKGIKQKLHKLKDENESLINQINERDRQIKILQNTQDQLLEDHKNRSSKISEREIQEQKNVSRLKAQLNELNMKLATSEMARKVAEQQLKSLEEKALRRENDTKSIQDILKQEYSTRLEEKANTIREECNNKHNEFVKQIVQEFRTCFDILPTITSSPNKISISPNKGQFVITADLNTANAAALEEVAMKLVKTASESIKYYSSEKKKNKKQFKELQALFNSTSTIPSEIIRAANSYVNNTKLQIESLQKQLLAKTKNSLSIIDSVSSSAATMPSKVMAAKDWENWARKLYMWSNKGQSVLLSIPAIMKSVEETVLEASGSNKLSRTINTLRTEKVILLQNKEELLFPSNSGQSTTMPTRLSSIVEILSFIRRVQRISGTLPSNLALVDSSSFNANNDDQSIYNKNDETSEKGRNRKPSMDDDDFQEEQEFQQKLQLNKNQGKLANDEAAIDAIVEEEEEVENQNQQEAQNEHGEEQ